MIVLKKAQKYSGILGVLVLWVSIVVGMNIAGLRVFDVRPISYLGVDPKTAGIFSAGLLVSAFLFINFAFYARRKFAVNGRFLTYFLIGQAGQIIAAISPYGSNSKFKTIHTIAAFVLAFSLPLLIRSFTVSQVGSPHHKLFTRLLRLEQLAFIVGIGLFVFIRGIAPLGEALPAIGFHTWIITLTFLQKRLP